MPPVHVSKRVSRHTWQFRVSPRTRTNIASNNIESFTCNDVLHRNHDIHESYWRQRQTINENRRAKTTLLNNLTHAGEKKGSIQSS